MRRLLARVVLGAMAVAVAACGSSGPSTPTAPQTITKIISVSGNLAFGTVNLGQTVTQSFTISNSGNTTLTFTGISATGGTGTSGILASQTSGVVPPSGSVTIAVAFTPTVAQFYSAVLNVASDATSGNAAINFSGTGFNNTPLFTKSGTGNNVFAVPSTVATLHITGTYTGYSSNFIVWIGPSGSACDVTINPGCHLLVNDLIGTGWQSTVSDGVYQTGGGTLVQVVDSSGVAWSMVEVRNAAFNSARYSPPTFHAPDISGMVFGSEAEHQLVLTDVAIQAQMAHLIR